MKKINCAYVDPGGNPTVLVSDRIPRNKQPKLAKEIIKRIPSCEQVGFIEPANNSKALCRLQMMGGEFCGNAARALAVFLAYSKNAGLSFNFESSGSNNLLTASVKLNINGDAVFSKFKTSLPYSVEKITLRLDRRKVNCKIVIIKGISLIVIPGRYYANNVDFLSCFRKLYQDKKVTSEAAGFVFYKKLANSKYKIVPVIYVRVLDSMVTETSCASGSIALALCLKKADLIVVQPSSYSLKVAVKGKTVEVGGKVKEIKFDKFNWENL